jgi:hypothetical protein
MIGGRKHLAAIDSLPPTLLLLPPLAVTLVLWITATNTVELAAVVYSFILFEIPWGSYLLWRRQGRIGIPLFAMISAMYWIFFVPTLYYGARTLLLSRLTPVNEDYIAPVLGMAVLAVVSLWVGIRMPFAIALPDRLPYIPEHQKNLTYLRAILLSGAVSSFFPWLAYLLGSDARQIMIILLSAVPIVAYVILLDRYLSGKAVLADKITLVSYVLIRILASLSSGWLGPLVGLGLTTVGLYVYRSRRVPWRYVVLTVGVVVFLQVGKTAYRDAYWNRASDASLIERVSFWIDTSTSQWFDPPTEGPASRGQLAAQTVERASLLIQVAHVAEITPSQVPFQNGSTYSYMAVTLIPRFLWPGKPSMSEANRFYQLAYGVSDRKGVETTSISVGIMAEAFLNFGWYGIAGIMFLSGLLLGLYERTFFAARSNTYFAAIGLALLPGFLAIESQFSQYFSAVIQQFVLILLVYLPIVTRRTVKPTSYLKQIRIASRVRPSPLTERR